MILVFRVVERDGLEGALLVVDRRLEGLGVVWVTSKHSGPFVEPAVQHVDLLVGQGVQDMAVVGLGAAGPALLRELAVEDDALGRAEALAQRRQRAVERRRGNVDRVANVALEKRAG